MKEEAWLCKVCCGFFFFGLGSVLLGFWVEEQFQQIRDLVLETFIAEAI